MKAIQENSVAATLNALYEDAKYDHVRMLKGVAKSIFRPMQPSDFKEAYLSISKEQGVALERLIVDHDLKNIVEFGTSFGISTLFLAQGAMKTGGTIITTELLENKARKARENFDEAGVTDLIEVRIGDALDTLSDHHAPIDLLLLDGWKDLYLPLFRMLEHNFHANTLIYVDNADMADSQQFLREVDKDDRYRLVPKHDGKVVLITLKT